MLTVYSKKNCPYCDQTKHLLTTKGVEFQVVNVDLDLNARAWLVDQGHRTVPQIYKDGQVFVEGGYKGLSALSDDELLSKLTA